MQPTTTTSPIDVVRRVYEAFGNSDLDALLSLVDPDVVVTQDAALPWGGRHIGRDGVIAFATALVSTIDSTVTQEAIFQAGDHVVQYGRTRGTVRTSGAPFDIPECHVWTVRDGRVLEATFHIDSAAMLEALEAS
jgi:ketosteroid isomerase-like protein